MSLQILNWRLKCNAFVFYFKETKNTKSLCIIWEQWFLLHSSHKKQSCQATSKAFVSDATVERTNQHSLRGAKWQLQRRFRCDCSKQQWRFLKYSFSFELASGEVWLRDSSSNQLPSVTWECLPFSKRARQLALDHVPSQICEHVLFLRNRRLITRSLLHFWIGIFHFIF